jgi:hypothetical protein
LVIATTEARLKNGATMSPQKRERYAEWLRNTGVEHPSDELINQTQKRALLQIHKAEQKARRHKFKLIVFTLGCLAAAVYVWLKL